MIIKVTGTSRRPEEQEEQHNVMPTPFRLFEDLFNNWARGTLVRRETWKPAVDILEIDNKFIVRAELPGMIDKDLDLKIDGNTLTIKAEKKMLPQESGCNYHQVESFYGSYSRSFDLPETVDVDNISASYNNGVLTVTIPQKAEIKPRSIKVAIG